MNLRANRFLKKEKKKKIEKVYTNPKDKCFIFNNSNGVFKLTLGTKFLFESLTISVIVQKYM